MVVQSAQERDGAGKLYGLHSVDLLRRRIVGVFHRSEGGRGGGTGTSLAILGEIGEKGLFDSASYTLLGTWAALTIGSGRTSSTLM